MNFLSPKLRRQGRGLALVLAAILRASAAKAYVLEGPRWASNTQIAMHLQLGSPGAPLLDGATSWDDVAASALTIWNQYLGSGVQFQRAAGMVGNVSHDGNNSVFFGNSVFGTSFGNDTVAVTQYYYTVSTGSYFSEADVVVNAAKSFNSYRGSVRGNVLDLRRILLHEFGHALGLNHVSQNTTAIMTPVLSDLDTLQNDDIAGVTAIYGVRTVSSPVVASTTAATGQVGADLAYQIVASGAPTTYAASGLPAGLSVNAASGLISGVPTVEGTFQVGLSAANAGGAGTGTLTLTISPSVVVVSPAVPPAVTVAATTASSGATGVFTLRLSQAAGGDLTVNYAVSGRAVNGVDYALLKGRKRIRAGKTSGQIKIAPLETGAGKVVKLQLEPGDGYTVGTTGKARLKIVGQ